VPEDDGGHFGAGEAAGREDPDHRRGHAGRAGPHREGRAEAGEREGAAQEKPEGSRAYIQKMCCIMFVLLIIIGVIVIPIVITKI
jgi:hypothetical protein